MIGKVRIQTGSTNKLELDGVDVSGSVTGFRVEFGLDHLPRVHLDVIGADPDLDMETAEVLLEGRGRDVLVKLGWTPPSE